MGPFSDFGARSCEVCFTPTNGHPQAARHVRKVPIGDMLAKPRIRANAQWSFVCVRKRPSAVNLLRAARDKQAAIVATAARAAPDRATPIEVAHADRPNPPGPSRARFAAVDVG